MRRSNWIKAILTTAFIGASFLKAYSQNETQNHWFWTIDVNPHGDQAYGGTDSIVYIDLMKKDSIIRLNAGGTVTKVKWNKAGNQLAVSSQNSDSLCFIFDVQSGRKTYLSNALGSRAIGWNHSEEFIAVGDNEGDLRIYTASGELLKTIAVKQKSVTGLSWHPTENKVVTVGHHIAIYNFDTDSIQHITPRKEEVLMLSVSWHPSGDFFVTGDYGDYIENHPALLQYWKANGELIKTIEGSNAEYRNLCWSVDGSTLATASDGIRLWNIDGDLVKYVKTNLLLWGVTYNSASNTLFYTNVTVHTLNHFVSQHDH